MKENYASFFARLERSLTRKHFLDIETAYFLTKFGHRHDERKEADAAGVPIRYFEHPRHVALILIDEVGCYDRDVIIIALLHDTVEDCRNIRLELLEHLFGKRVAGAVQRLTKKPKSGYVECLLQSDDWRALLVKAVDRLHNLRTLEATKDAVFKRKQLCETISKYYPIFDRMKAIVPPEWQERAQKLDALIRQTVIDLGGLDPRSP